jgi:hypothetical protein
MITALTYAIPAIVCLAIGYVLGFETCALTHSHQEAHPMIDRARRGVDFTVIAYLLASVALVVAGFTAYQGQAQDRARLACFNAYANQNAAAINARALATERRENATTDVFQTTYQLIQRKATPAELRHALLRYVHADAHLNDARRKHPYPEPPAEVCSP